MTTVHASPHPPPQAEAKEREKEEEAVFRDAWEARLKELKQEEQEEVSTHAVSGGLGAVKAHSEGKA